MTKSKSINISLGLFAHNEERNISKALKSILDQKLDLVSLDEIIVISSGSYDHTNKIVKKFAQKDKRIKLIEEIERTGKSSAINQFLHLASSPIAVTMSADLKLHSRALEEVGLPFLHDEVGMVGGHPIPANARYSSIGPEINLLWELHHQISLIKPKCGELVAFRNIIHQIPHNSAVDEATLEVLLQLIGYKTVYAPKSIVYNRGPKNASAFLTQRRRVYNGHQWVKTKYNYNVVTLESNQIIKVVVKVLLKKPKLVIPMIRLIFLEILARALGWLDFYLFKRNPFKWDMIDR